MTYFDVSRFFRFVIGPSTAAELETALGDAANKALFNQVLMDLEYSHRLVYDLAAMAKMGSSTTAVTVILNTRNTFVNLISTILDTYDATTADIATPAHRYGILKLVGGSAFGTYVAAVAGRAQLFVSALPGLAGYAFKSKVFIQAFKADQTKWGYLSPVANVVRPLVIAGTIKSHQFLAQGTLTSGAFSIGLGANAVGMTYSLSTVTAGVYNITNLNFPSAGLSNESLNQPAASINNPGPGASRLGTSFTQALGATGTGTPSPTFTWVSGLSSNTIYIGGFIASED